MAVFGGVGHYVADCIYTRDASGNLTSSMISSVLPTTATQKTCYTYDGLRQLTRAWTPNAATARDTAPMATKMGGLASMWIDYAYDTQTGNRTGVTTHSITGAVSTASYTYPAAGAARPHAVTGVTGPASFNPGTYGYDDAGNMTTRPGQQATFNEVGKVSKVVTGSATQTNIYHADGSLLLRVSSTEGASLTVGDTVLSQAVGSSVVAGYRTYSGAEGKPIAQRSAKTGTTGTTMTWLFTNLEGSVDTQTVANTGVTERNYRDPYGAPITMAGGMWADGNGYMNKPVTASSALTTVGARTYDPVLGKFLSVDPVIDANLPQQNTGYTYSGNNPITYTDPSGLRLDEGCGWARSCNKSNVGQDLTPRGRSTTNSSPFQSPTGPRKSRPSSDSKVYVGSEPDYPKPWEVVSAWWWETGPKDLHFRGGGYIDWIKSDKRFQAARKSILSPGAPGTYDVSVTAADGGWSTVGQMIQDGFVYSTWPVASEATDWDYQAQIGSYQGEATVTRSASNELRIDYKLYNVVSYRSASWNKPFGSWLDTMNRTVTQHFTWTEYVHG